MSISLYNTLTVTLQFEKTNETGSFVWPKKENRQIKQTNGNVDLYAKNTQEWLPWNNIKINIISAETLKKEK